MANNEIDEEANKTLTFTELGNFNFPEMPAQEAVENVWQRITERLNMFRGSQDEPIVAQDRMDAASDDVLDEVSSEPQCGQLQEELQKTLRDWLGTSRNGRDIKVIVLPPCQNLDLVEDWAKSENLELLMPPSRATLLDFDASEIDLGQGEGCIVIPRLERWFLRHIDGLDTVRALLSQITESRRKIVIGCNSWAWQFLSQSCEANKVLPTPLTFRAFDADRLYAWFRQMAIDEGSKDTVVRFSKDGAAVFKTEGLDDEERRNWFETLAAHSYGIPWVAWNMWRASLKRGDVPEDLEEDLPEMNEKDTLWTSATVQFSLPDSGDQTTLQTLYTLLQHGSLTAEQVAKTVPFVGASRALVMLEEADLVRCQDGFWSCRAIAYPAIRSGVLASGIQGDKL